MAPRAAAAGVDLVLACSGGSVSEWPRRRKAKYTEERRVKRPGRKTSVAIVFDFGKEPAGWLVRIWVNCALLLLKLNCLTVSYSNGHICS